jgi:hypothetical protein
MEKYMLLRDNCESGPYTLEALKSLNLRPKDLIWIEGASHSWQYPAEIPALKDHVKKAVHKPLIQRRLKVEETAEKEHVPVAKNASSCNAEVSIPYVDVKENYSSYGVTNTLWSKKVIPNNNILKVAVVFVGMLIGAICMKKMVDGIVDTTMGNESNAVSFYPAPRMSGANFQNALVTVISDGQKPKPVIKDPVSAKQILKQIKITSNVPQQVTANGVADTELTISNQSGHMVNQAEIQVNYIHNGDVILTEVYPIKSLKAHTFRTIQVPGNEKAEKISYKLINVYARQPASPFKIV